MTHASGFLRSGLDVFQNAVAFYCRTWYEHSRRGRDGGSCAPISVQGFEAQCGVERLARLPEVLHDHEVRMSFALDK
jgi:hypothetical protein